MPRRPSSLPLGWEPALSQLRTLSPSDLNAHVARWLRARGFRTICATSRSACCSNYTAVFGQAPFDLTVGFRVYQRRNRLQAHQIEAYLGSLVREGLSTGVLITTGEFSREAYRLAAQIPSPRIRLIAGPEWMADLAQRKVGIKRCSLASWLLSQTRSSSSAACERREVRR